METREKIFKYIHANPKKSITEIAIGLKINRMTVSKYCYSLESSGLIVMSRQGMKKVYEGKK